MSKFLDFRIREGEPNPNEEHSVIYNTDEYKYAMLDREITNEEFDSAIDVVFTFLVQQQMGNIYVDMKERNEKNKPVTGAFSEAGNMISYEDLTNMSVGDLIKLLGTNVMNIDKKEESEMPISNPCDICEYNPNGVNEEAIEELL